MNHIDKLTPELIEKYAQGKLSHAQMHEVEKLMLESEFDAEAMEGFENAGVENLSNDLKSLNNRLESRVKQESKIVTLYLKIAASILLLALVTYTVFEIIPADEINTIGQVETPEAFEEALETPAKEEAQESVASEAGASEAAVQEEAPVNETIIPKVSTSDVVTPNDEAIENENLQPDEAAQIEYDFEVAEEDFTAMEDEVKEHAEDETIAQDETKKSKSRSRIASAKRIHSRALNPEPLIGKVINEDSTPLPGVNIVLKGTNLGTVTDLQGQYSIQLPESSDSTLVASFIGYETKEVKAEGRSKMDIQLTQNYQQLSEIVVTATGEEAPGVTKTDAAPVDGYKAYETYLDKNAMSSEKRSTVTISFVVDTDGSLHSFEVIEGTNEDLTANAIDLIKNGPVWAPAIEDNQAVPDTVAVKVKFRPKK